MTRQNKNLKTTDITDGIISFIARTPTWLYIIVAGILIVAAILSLYEAGTLSMLLIRTQDFSLGKGVLIALFHAITAIVLLETTIVFFRTAHLAVQTLLIAGLTESIRHVLVYDVMTMDPMHIFALVSVIAVLIAGIVMTKNEFEPVKTAPA